jgi:hypothetical protein
MYICIYIYMHMHIFIFIHIFIFRGICMYIHLFIFFYIRVLLQRPEKSRQANSNKNFTIVQDKITQSCLNSPRNSQNFQSDMERMESMIKNRMVIAKKRNLGALRALVQVQSRIRMLGPRRIYLERIAVGKFEMHIMY